MPGATYAPGEVKPIPDVYVRVMNAGGIALPVVSGRVAAIFRSERGPTVPTLVRTRTKLEQLYGRQAAGVTVEVAGLALDAGAFEVMALRLGRAADGSVGGALATLNLQDTTAGPINVLGVDALDNGAGGNDIRLTVRTASYSSAVGEFLVYSRDATTGVMTLRETYKFATGAPGIGEPQSLYNAVMDSSSGTPVTRSSWITLRKLADGNKLLARIVAGPAVGALAGGATIPITNQSYTDAMNALEMQDWNELATDSEANAVHLLIQGYVDRVRANGKRISAHVAEPTSVAQATRLADAAAFNDLGLMYWLNGFKLNDGTVIEGYKAAAYMAGISAKLPTGESLDNYDVHRLATSVVGALDTDGKAAAISSGAAYFDKSARQTIVSAVGITTFRTPDSVYDLGWSKKRRQLARDRFISDVVYEWDALRGRFPNTDAPNEMGAGRAIFVQKAQSVLDRYVRRGAFESGFVAVNTDEVNAGDTASFVAYVRDLDNIAKAYFAIGFQY